MTVDPLPTSEPPATGEAVGDRAERQPGVEGRVDVEVDVEVAAYGRAASEALGRAVVRAKRAGPLTPVTVIVPSHLAGLTARRLLGAGTVGTSTGVANVTVLTVARLAELLSADLLTDTRPVTDPIRRAAVRRALATDPGPFARAAHHHATEAALAAVQEELASVSPRSLGAMATSGSDAAATIAFHRVVATHLAGYHDASALARAAAARPDLPTVLEPFGHLVWFLPAPLPAPGVALLRAAFAVSGATVIVGCSGDAVADRPVAAACRAAGIEVDLGAGCADPRTGATIDPPTAAAVVSVTDADEEVRAAVRRIVAAAEAGVALDRIGIFHPVADPYVGILEQQLAAAGIPANGPTRRRLADSVAGRTLLGVLALPGQRWRRDRVLALVGDAPLRHDGKRVRAGDWEAESRAAGVVHDLSDWRTKLARHRDQLEADEAAWSVRRPTGDAPESSAPTPPGPASSGLVRAPDGTAGSHGDEGESAPARPTRGQRRVAAVDGLGAFVEHLASALAGIDLAEGWAAKATATDALLTDLLGDGRHHDRWPEDEVVALERVQDVLGGLAALDALDPSPTREVFLRALTAELDTTCGRSGRFGHGVAYGPLASAPGHDLDLVIVLGCAEGLLPRRRADDSLLSDRARAASLDELERRDAEIVHQHRQLLAALAAAPDPHDRMLTFARGDLRSNRSALPSRWLLDSASALAGHTVHATDFAALGLPVVDVVPSFAAGLLRAPVDASVHERDLAVLTRHVRAGGRPLDHPVAALVRPGLTMQAARSSPRFTPYDGNLAGQPIPSTADRPQSPTRLQSWAECGFRYFLGHVLGLADRDDPERVITIDARDRGSLVHDVLEQFIRDAMAEGTPAPEETWSAAHRQRLGELAEAAFAQYEDRGRTGRPVHWRLVSETLRDLFVEFADADDRFRAEHGVRPIEVELPFGLDDRPPVTVDLPGGRQLAFRGVADRVDAGTDGHMVVSDYKTGKMAGYAKIHEGDPVRSGRTLQLAIYAEAAIQHLGATSVQAHYWSVEPGGGFRRHGYEWDDARRQRFVEVVTAITDGVEDGVFPLVPGEWDDYRGTHEACVWCAFDSVCPRDRGEQAEAKLAAPEVRRRAALDWVEPAADLSQGAPA